MNLTKCDAFVYVQGECSSIFNNRQQSTTTFYPCTVDTSFDLQSHIVLHPVVTSIRVNILVSISVGIKIFI